MSPKWKVMTDQPLADQFIEIRNRQQLRAALCKLLYEKNWKIRCKFEHGSTPSCIVSFAAWKAVLLQCKAVFLLAV